MSRTVEVTELALRDGDTLEGTFAGAGLPAPQRWTGVRAGRAGGADVPCRRAD